MITQVVGSLVIWVFSHCINLSFNLINHISLKYYITEVTVVINFVVVLFVVYIYTQIQRYFGKLKTNVQCIGWNSREYILDITYIDLMENEVYLLFPSLLLSMLILISRWWGGGLIKGRCLLQNMACERGGLHTKGRLE